MDETDSKKTAPGGEPQPGRALNVLLAEDNRLNQIYIKRTLEKNGHRVTVVEDAEAVLRQLEMARFDLILMDVQMPVMDGLEAARRIRGYTGSAFAPQIPIVALTAYSTKSDRELFLEAGMNGFLSKPVDAEALFEEIGRVMARPNPTPGSRSTGLS